MCRKVSTLFLICLAVVLLTPAALAQSEPICGDEERQAFSEAVENGLSDDELEALFGHCREDLEPEPTCKSQEAGALGALVDPLKIISTGGSSTWYERMTGCGYHPQNRSVFCDIELRRNTGYGGFPWGSTEHVLFCFDCNQDGIWDHLTRGSVHVTNNISGTPPSWYFNASGTTWNGPNMCNNTNGAAMTVQATLGWWQAPRNCGHRPFWGNRITFTTRKDP